MERSNDVISRGLVCVASSVPCACVRVSPLYINRLRTSNGLVLSRLRLLIVAAPGWELQRLHRRREGPHVNASG